MRHPDGNGTIILHWQGSDGLHRWHDGEIHGNGEDHICPRGFATIGACAVEALACMKGLPLPIWWQYGKPDHAPTGWP